MPRSVNELIQFAESRLSKQYVSVARAFHTGTVENLGGFKHVAGGCGWILKLTSKHGSIYYIAIVAHYLGYRIAVLDKPPWKYWEGDTTENKMYQGDNPEIYKLLRDKEIRDAKNKSNETTV